MLPARPHRIKVKIIPLVVGSVGAIPKQFGNRLKQIGITEDSFTWNG